MKEGMGDNGRKEFLSREKALSASGNFFPAKWNSREDARAYGFVRGERVWKIFIRCIMYVYMINNLFRKCEIREGEKYDVSGLFEGWMGIGCIYMCLV